MKLTGMSTVAVSAPQALGQAPIEAAQLARAISHDLRNALLIIRAYTTVLKTSIADPQSRQDLEEIDNAVDRAAELTDRLRALAPTV
jgi:signal transduction histidine kinase